MARNGFLIFDSDTHVGPSMDILETYLSADEKAQVEPLNQYRRVTQNDSAGREQILIGVRKYERRLGEAGNSLVTGAQKTPWGSSIAGYTGKKRRQEPNPWIDHDPALRIADMDLEGADVNLLLPSGWYGSLTTIEDIGLELAINRAYHRWMQEYCAAYPERLTGVVFASGRDVENSLPEVRRAAREPWAMGLFVWTPYGMPLDHPDLKPYWQVAQETDLAVILHTFTAQPPYAPGGLDTWDNSWLQRTAAHPWCGMRNMAAIIGSGVFDRYPDLRVGVLEAGQGWLPFWAHRMDEQAEMLAASLAPLEHPPSHYISSGRYFQSIEISEGEKLTKSVIDHIGDHVLMYSSDYNHGECWFPDAVDSVMKWDMSDEMLRKFLWQNACNLYRRYSGGKKLAAMQGVEL